MIALQAAIEGIEVTQVTMPTWFQMFLALLAAIGTTYGGFELVKYLLSLRANRRKDNADAHAAAADAGQKDADWRQKELEVMTSIIDTTKRQYEDLAKRYGDLQAEKEEDREIKAQLRRELSEVRIELSEHQRILCGIQRAWTTLIAQKKDAERHYCADEKCAKRKPKLGEYETPTIEFDSLVLRDKKTGRFIAKPK